MQVMAKEGGVSVLDHMKGTRERMEMSDPITAAGKISERWNPCRTEAGSSTCHSFIRSSEDLNCSCVV